MKKNKIMNREREQEIRVSLYADKMLRLALDNKNKIMHEKTFPEWEKNINNILNKIDKISNNEYFKRESIKIEYKNKK